MTLKKDGKTAGVVNKRPTNAKHNTFKPTRGVHFSVTPSPEVVGDAFLQATDKRRRYMRRGSRCPSMFAIHAVRSSAEVAQCEADDIKQEKLEQKKQSLLGMSRKQVIRRSFSLPSYQPAFSKEAVNRDLARSLFHKTNLTVAQKRRLSLDILSQVHQELEARDLSGSNPPALASL